MPLKSPDILSGVQTRTRSIVARRVFPGLAALTMIALPMSAHAGTWTKITNAPPAGFSNAMLLTDGTVMCADGNNAWYKLTPDIHGSYVNGTWTQLASMIDTRLYYSSQVLLNGKVYVCGGEYGTGANKSELYDPIANTWTALPYNQLQGTDFTDVISQLLPDGTLFQGSTGTNCQIYNPTTNSYGGVMNTNYALDEADWAKLPDDSLLTIDPYNGMTAERYIPATQQWVKETPPPVNLWATNGEIGSSNLLPNGKVFVIGGSGNTVVYTPTGNASAGSWVIGPTIPGGNGAVDAPAAAETSGLVLFNANAVNTFNAPTSFYEYDYNANTITQVNGPNGVTDNTAAYGTFMLDLPDGTILYKGSDSIYFYTPSSSPLFSGKPTISSVSQNPDGSFHLTGTLLNGISQGARYGDDKQMDSNYPIVRLTNNATGNVYYARTYNWSSTGVMTGSKVMSTEFALPAGLPNGSYSLVSVANGNPSSSVAFNVPFTNPNGYNVNGIDTQGTPSVNGGFDNVGYAVDSSQVGTSATWNGKTFTFGTANTVDCWSNTTAPVTGSGNTLYMLATGVNGNQANQTFTVHYTDGTTSTFTQSLSDWFTPQSYAGESTAITMTDRLTNSGAVQSATCYIYGYSTLLTAGKTIQSVTLPATRSVVVLAFALGNTVVVPSAPAGLAASGGSTQVSLSWTASSGATSYNVYRGTTAGGESATAIATGVTGTSYTNTGLTNGTTYYYTVKAVNTAGTSGASNEAKATANAPTAFNVNGIYTQGTATANGGFDGGGSALDAAQVGTGVTWNGQSFTWGPANAANCWSKATLNYSHTGSTLYVIGAGVQGNQTSQTFTVLYTDGSTSSFSQNISDWFTPQNYAGESKVITMADRLNSNGSVDSRTFYVYGYSFPLTSGKTIRSVILPSNRNVVILGVGVH